MLEQKLMGSNLTFENNTFSTTLLYTPDKTANRFSKTIP